MAFTVEDYHDLVRLLRECPEWKEELRNLLLGEEILSFPQAVRESASEVRALASRVEALAESQKRLAEAQRRTKERVEALATQVSELVVQVGHLAEAQGRTEERLDALIASHQRLKTVGRLRGQMPELTYARRVTAYFGTLLRGAQAVELRELERNLEEALTKEEFRDVLLLGLLV